jgi:hypothetical protein
VALIALEHSPSLVLLYVMVAAQGGLGYGLTSIFGAVVAEIYQGKHYGSIFGTLMLASDRRAVRWDPGPPACCTTRRGATR